VSDVVRFRVTSTFEYEIPLDAAIDAYGTDDPHAMAHMDEMQMEEDGDAIFVIMDGANFTSIKVEPVL